jgi:5'-3' exonuclease
MINLLDFNNLLFISVHSYIGNMKKEGNTVEKDLKIEGVIDNYFSRFHWLMSQFGKIIICVDGMNSTKWRKTIYPSYKENRDRTDYSYIFFNNIKPLVLEMLGNYPVKIISVPMAEADDVIYILSKKYSNEGVRIISTDKDLLQIMNYFPNIIQYNPMWGKEYEQNKYIVERKIFIGDPSDGIPGIGGIGEKTFSKMLKSQEYTQKKLKGINREILKKFKMIVDLRLFPKEIHDTILANEGEKDYIKFNQDEIENLLFNNGCKSELLKWGYTKENIRRIL